MFLTDFEPSHVVGRHKQMKWKSKTIAHPETIDNDVEGIDEGAKPAAVRDDGGKLKWHLLPVPALLGLIKVFHGGALKYAEDQWRGGMKFSRIYRSMISHFLKWLASNSSYDKELGTHHLMMVAWGCFVLYMYEAVYKFTDYDDRPEKGLLTEEDFEFINAMIENKLNPLDKDDAAR